MEQPSECHSKEGLAMSPNDTAIVHLTQGKIAYIDAADADLVESYGRWSADKRSNGFYARYSPDRIYLHRLIMGFPDGLVDHQDGDTLNCRRSNLRIVTPSQSVMNTRIRSDNKSGHRGVIWDKARGKWRAEIKVHPRRIHLGRFDLIEDAIAAYAAAAEEYFGEYRRSP